MPDLSIYINFPFCRQKCHFCDWVQRIPKADLFLKADDSLRINYVAALCREIRQKGSYLAKKGYLPRVIYFGGGTATTMSPDELNKIIESLHETFDLSKLKEWTIEGSPDTVSLESLQRYKQLGFNRCSFGIQSFNEQRLKHLARRHNVAQSIAAVEMARTVGFENINIDLMCGFSDETLEEIKNNIEVAVKLAPPHLSLYTFRPTEGTVMRKLLDRQEPLHYVSQQVKAYEYGRQLLIDKGYPEYGVGYFGRVAENVVAMFSLLYDVIGFGSGAVSVSERHYYGHTSGKLHNYIDDPLVYDYQTPVVNSPSVLLSLLRSGLSIYEGVRRDLWLERFGESMTKSFSRDDLRDLIALFIKIGGLVQDDQRIFLTRDKAPLALIGLINGSMLKTD